jgi:hypothetical protein
MQLQIRHLGMNRQVWRELKMQTSCSVCEHLDREQRLSRIFQWLFNGMSVEQNECFPDNRIGLFNEDMVLLGWVQLGGDNEARKKEGVEKCCGGAGKIGI